MYYLIHSCTIDHLCLCVVQMGDSLSPTPATTAEEALATSQEAGAMGGPAREGEGAVGGEEPVRDAEAWAAALPPVSFVLFNQVKCIAMISDSSVLYSSLHRIYTKFFLVGVGLRV